jgi:CspA family cold shock protein
MTVRNPPRVVATQVPQPNTMPVQPGLQQSKAPGITVRTISTEIHGLVERVLAGEIPFVLEVCRDDDSPPLRAKLVPDVPPATLAPRPKLEPTPRAELDERAKRLFKGACEIASSASKDGWVNLAEYGSTLKKFDATFQPQDFGEKSLGGLVRRMTDVFEVKSDGNTPPVYYIRLKPHAATIQPPPQPISSPSQESAQARRHATGKIHNLKLGFGFIAPDDGSDNTFFHATEVIGCTIFDLRPGDPVEYEAGENERGACAWKVRRLSGNPENRTT